MTDTSDTKHDPNDGVPIFANEAEAREAVEREARGMANNVLEAQERRDAAYQAVEAMRTGFDAAELDSYDTLAQGQADDLKYESADGVRYWLSRTGVADGEPFENTVTIEVQVDGTWKVVAKYDGGEIEEPMGVEGDADEERSEAAQRYADGHIGKFVLEIEPGNAAMQTGGDVAATLLTVADQIAAGEPTAWNGEGIVRDDNGNTVGRWTFHDHN